MLQINIELCPERCTCACTRLHAKKIPTNEQNCAFNRRSCSESWWPDRPLLRDRGGSAPIVFARPLPILMIFSAPCSHHVNVSSIIKIWCTKWKYWGLNSHNVFPRAQPSTPGPPQQGPLHYKELPACFWPHHTSPRVKIRHPSPGLTCSLTPQEFNIKSAGDFSFFRLTCFS